jgi:hypothetical protein
MTDKSDNLVNHITEPRNVRIYIGVIEHVSGIICGVQTAFPVERMRHSLSRMLFQGRTALLKTNKKDSDGTFLMEAC